MSAPRAEVVLFAEPGARWRALSYGPLLCLVILILEIATGSTVHWFALVFCAVVISAFVSLQIVAGRRHVSVELTPTTLRCGTEIVRLGSIDEVLPAADADDPGDPLDPTPEVDWESARALGELSGVPRRRTGIGLRLRGGGIVQAWARDHRGLRAALAHALSTGSTSPADETDPSAERKGDR